MTISYSALRTRHHQAEIDAVTAVFVRRTSASVRELAAFESAFAAYHAVPHAIAVSSGTAGLHIALLTLGIGPGDEVIIPSFTFIAVANAVLQAGATPVFADIDPVTLNLDPAASSKLLHTRTRAIIVVHTFGVPRRMRRTARSGRSPQSRQSSKTPAKPSEPHFSRSRVGTFGDLRSSAFIPTSK